MTLGEVISTGQVGAKADAGVGHSRGGGKEVYPGAGAKLFIDRNFNRNQQINSASVK